MSKDLAIIIQDYGLREGTGKNDCILNFGYLLPVISEDNIKGQYIKNDFTGWMTPLSQLIIIIFAGLDKCSNDKESITLKDK